MKLLKTMDKFLTAFEENVMAISSILMVVVLVINFVGRYFLGSSVGWTEEVGKLCIVSMTYLGLSHVTKPARHINMTMLIERFSERGQHIMQIIINLGSAAFFYYLTYSACRYALEGVMTTGRVTTNLRIPVYILVLAMALGLFFTAIRFTQIFILNVIHQEAWYCTDHPGPVVETESPPATDDARKE